MMLMQQPHDSPTAEEVESIYHHAAELKAKQAENGILAKKISAVNG